MQLCPLFPEPSWEDHNGSDEKRSLSSLGISSWGWKEASQALEEAMVTCAMRKAFRDVIHQTTPKTTRIYDPSKCTQMSLRNYLRWSESSSVKHINMFKGAVSVSTLPFFYN